MMGHPAHEPEERPCQNRLQREIVRDFTRLAPKRVDFAGEFSRAANETPPTTMMLRNVPNRYTQSELIQELGSLGFASSFDFFYAPIDFKTMALIGYAFINFNNAEWADRCRLDLEGYVFKKHQKKTSPKAAIVSVAHLQGLRANAQHYGKSAKKLRSKGYGPLILRPSDELELPRPEDQPLGH